MMDDEELGKMMEGQNDGEWIIGLYMLNVKYDANSGTE